MASDDISRQQVFDTIVREAGSLYRSIVTIASAFLGGTLLFLERLLPDPPLVSVLLMGLGGLLLVLAMVRIIHVRVDNLESGRLALIQEFDRAKALDASKSSRTKNAADLLAAGLFCIMIAGIIALWSNQ